MRDVRKVGRRAWLARSATGVLTLWAGLDLGLGREGWGILIGRAPRAAAAPARGEPTATDAPTAGAETTAHLQAEPTAADALRVTLGAGGFVSAYVMVRGGEAAIVDTGVPGSGAAIGEVVSGAGLGMEAVRHVILTHYHGDHAGSIGEVLEMASGAAVYAGEADIPRITAPREITPVADGSEVFGLQIIATPGHTAGHVSVYDPIGSALVTGDAVVNVGGTLARSLEQFTADIAQAKYSTPASYAASSPTLAA